MADHRPLHRILSAEIITLSLFAPHLAEEIWHRLGHRSYVVRERWPVLERRCLNNRPLGSVGGVTKRATAGWR